MIVVTDINIFDDGNPDTKRSYKVSLFADTKAEVVAIGNKGDTVRGMTKGSVMTIGSTCLCATGDFGMLDSNGTWHW